MLAMNSRPRLHHFCQYGSLGTHSGKSRVDGQYPDAGQAPFPPHLEPHHLSKMGEKRKEDLQKEELDLTPLFKDTVEQFRPLVKADDKTLSLTAPDTLPVMTDQRSLVELINILMDNAVKYCDAKGTIAASLTRRGKQGLSLLFPMLMPKGKERTILIILSGFIAVTVPMTAPFLATGLAYPWQRRWSPSWMDRSLYPIRIISLPMR